MNTLSDNNKPSWLPSAVARERLLLGRWEPLFTADWDRVLMLHYEVSAEVLQTFVPYELDLWEGKAYVSLVAFTMRDLAPARGGWLTAFPFRPIATHGFLNVRTYVKQGGETGIFFLAEWLPNALSVLLGRPVFGLPYRLGTIHYEHLHEQGRLSGSVVAWEGLGVLRYKAELQASFATCIAGSREEFLMERYTAFTEWKGWKRCFRVWHPPWTQCAVEVEVEEDSLIQLTGDWAKEARLVAANYSPGHVAVWMGKPEALCCDRHK
jgi:uncharacterized protein